MTSTNHKPHGVNRIESPRVEMTRLNEYLKENKLRMTDELADIMVISIKEFFPVFYEGCIYKGWSNWKIVHYAGNIELPTEDLIKLLKHASRLSKIWIFS